MAKRQRGEIDLRKFGKKIKEARANLKISQLELSNESDVSIRQIQRIELGHCDAYISTIFKILKVLKLKSLEF